MNSTLRTASATANLHAEHCVTSKWVKKLSAMHLQVRGWAEDSAEHGRDAQWRVDAGGRGRGRQRAEARVQRARVAQQGARRVAAARLGSHAPCKNRRPAQAPWAWARALGRSCPRWTASRARRHTHSRCSADGPLAGTASSLVPSWRSNRRGYTPALRISLQMHTLLHAQGMPAAPRAGRGPRQRTAAGRPGLGGHAWSSGATRGHSSSSGSSACQASRPAASP